MSYPSLVEGKHYLFDHEDLFKEIKTTLFDNAVNILLDKNDRLTRTILKSNLDCQFEAMMAKRWLYDFMVVCDETNNTPFTISLNQLHVDLYFKTAPVASEFYHFPLEIGDEGIKICGDVVDFGYRAADFDEVILNTMNPIMQATLISPGITVNGVPVTGPGVAPRSVNHQQTGNAQQGGFNSGANVPITQGGITGAGLPPITSNYQGIGLTSAAPSVNYNAAPAGYSIMYSNTGVWADEKCADIELEIDPASMLDVVFFGKETNGNLIRMELDMEDNVTIKEAFKLQQLHQLNRAGKIPKGFNMLEFVREHKLSRHFRLTDCE